MLPAKLQYVYNYIHNKRTSTSTISHMQFSKLLSDLQLLPDTELINGTSDDSELQFIYSTYKQVSQLITNHMKHHSIAILIKYQSTYQAQKYIKGRILAVPSIKIKQ